jgi:hypothetical protein
MFLPALATVVFLIILLLSYYSYYIIYMYATQQDAPHRNETVMD